MSRSDWARRTTGDPTAPLPPVPDPPTTTTTTTTAEDTTGRRRFSSVRGFVDRANGNTVGHYVLRLFGHGIPLLIGGVVLTSFIAGIFSGAAYTFVVPLLWWLALAVAVAYVVAGIRSAVRGRQTRSDASPASTDGGDSATGKPEKENQEGAPASWKYHFGMAAAFVAFFLLSQLPLPFMGGLAFFGWTFLFLVFVLAWRAGRRGRWMYALLVALTLASAALWAAQPASELGPGQKVRLSPGQVESMSHSCAGEPKQGGEDSDAKDSRLVACINQKLNWVDGAYTADRHQQVTCENLHEIYKQTPTDNLAAQYQICQDDLYGQKAGDGSWTDGDRAKRQQMISYECEQVDGLITTLPEGSGAKPCEAKYRALADAKYAHSSYPYP